MEPNLPHTYEHSTPPLLSRLWVSFAAVVLPDPSIPVKTTMKPLRPCCALRVVFKRFHLIECQCLVYTKDNTRCESFKPSSNQFPSCDAECPRSQSFNNNERSRGDEPKSLAAWCAIGKQFLIHAFDSLDYPVPGKFLNLQACCSIWPFFGYHEHLMA